LVRGENLYPVGSQATPSGPPSPPLIILKDISNKTLQADKK